MTDTETTTETKDEALAERHGFVDFDKIEDPEVRKQVQDRIHGLYQSQKEAANVANEARRMYSNMERKLAALEAKQAEKENNAELDGVRQKIAKAHSTGDYETATKLTESLIDRKAPKETKPDNRLEEHNAQLLMSWQSTLTDDGRLQRPWAHKTHPRYNETIGHLTSVTNELGNVPFTQILKEVDKRMAPPQQAAPVADTDTTPPRPSGKTVQLSEGQKRAAVRLYPNKKPADAIKAYAEAQKKYGGQ